MVKKRKKLSPIIMHQHVDESGRIYGAKHPVDSEHNNIRTQMHHDFTVGKRKRMNKK